MVKFCCPMNSVGTKWAEVSHGAQKGKKPAIAGFG
jgi:hypothetical protein